MEVLRRIFEKEVIYQPEVLKLLQEAMVVRDLEDLQASFYGKTGTGMTDGIVVDAWFTGFTERTDGNVYFCVYLGQTDGKEVSSSIAKEIAIQIVSDYCNN